MTRYILPLFSAFALYAVFYFSASNGLFQLIDDAVRANKLADTAYPLRTVYTGVEPVDRLLTVLVVFFWSALDGYNAGSVLHALYFAGAFGSAWVLVILEAWRVGNSWTVPAFPMIFGLAAQVMTYAFATPLYCGIQLKQSITARKPDASNIAIPHKVLRFVPPVFVIGYIVPSALMILQAPSQISVDLKQILIAVWQPWPAYISILLSVIGLLFSRSRNVQLSDYRATRSALRWVYAFAFANAALSHIIAWTVSLATVLSPTVFSREHAGFLHPRSVFQFIFPWVSPAFVARSIAPGVHVFLQWDYLIGSVAVLVWGLSLYIIAHRVLLGRVGYLGLGVKTVFLVSLSGPVATAVELVWERDELVFQETRDLSARKVAGSKKMQ